MHGLNALICFCLYSRGERGTAEHWVQLNKGSQKEDIESCVQVSLFLDCLDHNSARARPGCKISDKNGAGLSCYRAGWVWPGCRVSE